MQAGRAVGLVVGLRAEARLARGLGALVAVGGGTVSGAARAAERLADQGVTALVSFGLAGGLDPMLEPGAVLVPEAVVLEGESIPADAGLTSRLGGPTPHRLLAGDAVVANAAEKAGLWQRTGCAAIDIESGAVARVAAARGLPFAVLRAVCDPATRTLPPAALIALDANGVIGLGRVLAAVLARPGQVPALLALARDAAVARRVLLRHVARLEPL